MQQVDSVGFTGTEQGMTKIQKASFAQVISVLRPRHFHHGDCVGSDAEAHYMVRMIIPKCNIHIWPPSDPKARAWCIGDFLELELPYLTRDKAIAYAAEVLLATPKEDHEILRSGTWATVRYARKMYRRVLILPPDKPFRLNEQIKLWEKGGMHG